jgi:lipopolysaccharide export system protein LptA
MRLRKLLTAGLVLFSLILLTPLKLEGQLKQIEILNADITQYDFSGQTQISRLLGNVRFKHEDVLMNCDSAHYFPTTNTLDAFSNVHLWRADSLDLYGNFLRYNGNDKTTSVRGKVTLIDKQTKLNTENIDYDLNRDVGFYSQGGIIENGNNIITSIRGQYFAKENEVFFKDSVTVTNPDYIIYCDTLKYNTVSEITYFMGPTEIVSDSNLIYCENGWYDTRNNIARFSRNAYLQSENQLLKGDSLYYERETGYGEGLNNVELIDSAKNVILKGNFAVYFEQSGEAMMTDRAVMVQVDNGDSLYIHADTLRLLKDSIPDNNLIKAYNHVKIFRFDIQGKCDSLVYADLDSAFRFFGEPVLWSEDNQLTAEFITIHTSNNSLSKVELTNTAFIISQEDSGRFNQVKGRDMEGFFVDNELVRIDVNGNGQTFYYARDGDELIGVNKANSANLVIFLNERKFDRILFLTNPDATYQPLELLKKEEEQLENFKWYDDYRPLVWEDIFIWNRNESTSPNMMDKEEITNDDL